MNFKLIIDPVKLKEDTHNFSNIYHKMQLDKIDNDFFWRLP